MFAVLLLNIWCSYSVLDGKGKQETNLKSLFLKGEKKHRSVWVEEYDDGDDHVEPAHFESHYYFELAPEQPKFVVEIIEWGLIIIALSTPFLVYGLIKISELHKFEN